MREFQMLQQNIQMEESKCRTMEEKVRRNAIKENKEREKEDLRKITTEHKGPTISNKQLIFCENFSIGKTAVESARIAGYKANSDRSLRSIASKILSTKCVRKYLEERKGEIQKNTHTTLEYVTENLTSIIERCSKSLYSEGSPKTRELDLVIRALDQYNKIYGHYLPERHINVNVDATGIQDLVSKYEKQY